MSELDKPTTDVPDQPPVDSLPAAIDMEQHTLGEAFSRLQLLYQYSSGLPDTLRNAGAYASELVRGSANWLVPSAFRNSRSYSIFMRQMLDYVMGDSVNVAAEPSDATGQRPYDQVFVAQHTFGSLLDMTALATFHVSPLTVLAIFSEVAYDSHLHMQQLFGLLRQQQIVSHTPAQPSADLLVQALQQALHTAAATCELPLISIAGLQQTIAQTRATVAQLNPYKLLSPIEVDQLLRQMELAAQQQQASIWDLSATISLVALNKIQSIEPGELVSLEVSGNMYQQHIIDHYWEGLRAIEQQGLLKALAQASEPYLETVWNNYAVDRKSWTGQLLSAELLKWGWSKVAWPKLIRG
ncbi:MAG: hypothetical protein KF752_01005 [Pirellulaceae bacterium]|nr:hypothetical protein [Pirellulaceae bacterium]